MFEDIKRTIEAATKDLTAERAQKIARNLLEPGARKDQVTAERPGRVLLGPSAGK